MKMHGLHDFGDIPFLKNKPINEIIVLLEEIFTRERLELALSSSDKHHILQMSQE